MKLLFFGATLFSSALYGQTVRTAQYSSSASAHQIVINEVLADPSPQQGLPPVEFVELYNRGSDTINFSGWTFYDGSAKAMPALKLPPGSYVVVCAVTDTSWFNMYGSVAGLSSLSLTNSGEKIAVRDPSGMPVDSLTYSDAWYNGSYKADGGWSLERIDTSFVCLNDKNWTASESSSGGTPGSVNSVAGIFSDTDPPVPLNAYCPDATTLHIRFSEPIEENHIDSVRIEFPAGLIADSVYSAGGDRTAIRVLLSDTLHAGVTYTCSISQVRDCPGNMMPGVTELKFGIADTMIQPRLVINEVLFNPPEGGVDFVEVYNTGNTVADLTACTLLSYDETTGLPKEVVEIDGEPWLLFPGMYAVLTESPESVAAFYDSPYPKGFPPMEDLPAMNVDAGEIGLLFRGETLDRFRYSEEDHFLLLNERKGVSLERIDPMRPSADKSNWHSAAEPAGFATPGFRNSQYASGGTHAAGAVAVPEVFSPDNDGVDDVVTFKVQTPGAGYIGSIVIYHSDGAPVRELVSQQLTGTESEYSWDGSTDYGTRAPLGLYVAVIQFFSLQGDVQKVKVPVVLAARF